MHTAYNHAPAFAENGMNISRTLTMLVLLLLGAHAQETTLEGATAWHGYTRRDGEINGRKLIVVSPDQAAPGRPWIWRARFFGHEPQTDVALLAQGFHLVYVDVGDLFGNDTALATWDACYEHVTTTLGLGPRPAIECMSRGGLIAYRWAAAHPDRVACIYADAPVCDIRSWPGGKGKGRGHAPSWQRCLDAHGLDDPGSATWKGDPIDQLEPLAKAKIPLLHVCGDADPVVPIDENTHILASRYRALGGRIRVLAKPGVGHHPHSLADPAPIVSFILRHTVGSGDWFTLRDGLTRCRQRFTSTKRGRVAFLGGSITCNPGWRDQVCADLRKRFPDTRFDFINAGISSFGSTPGAFRMSRDVFGNGPVDLLFVEAAVNDSTNGRSKNEMLRGMEGIVRHARRRDPGIDIVMLQFADPQKIRAMDRGIIPPVIAIHERVAERYRTPSIDLALEVAERIQNGDFTWKDDFKNLHPSPFGQKLYAASVRRLFDAAWKTPATDTTPEPHSVPSPLDTHSYTRGRLVPVHSAKCDSGWQVDPSWTPTDGKGTRAGFVRVPMLVSSKPGATLALNFTGAAVGILVTAGPDAGVVESRVDGGPWKRTDLITRWSRGLHLPWSHVLHVGLTDRPHRLDVRFATKQPSRSPKPVARIAWFLVDGDPPR